MKHKAANDTRQHKDRVTTDLSAVRKYQPHYRPPPKPTPSVRLARTVVRQLHSQLGKNWENRVVDGQVTVKVTLKEALVKRVIWELSGAKK